jgi:hypothetical protein
VYEVLYGDVRILLFVDGHREKWDNYKGLEHTVTRWWGRRRSSEI